MKQFFGNFTNTHNSFTGLLSVLAGFWAVSGDFRLWVAQLLVAYQHHVPSLLQPVPALGFALWMWYHNGQKPTNGAVKNG